jgi:Cft2 family RNA processing exonuclease
VFLTESPLPFPAAEFSPRFVIDRFPSFPDGARRPTFALLSHAHSDHMNGLENWPGLVYCTRQTRTMVTKYAAVVDRVSLELGIIGKDHPKLSKYSNVQFVRHFPACFDFSSALMIFFSLNSVFSNSTNPQLSRI